VPFWNEPTARSLLVEVEGLVRSEEADPNDPEEKLTFGESVETEAAGGDEEEDGEEADIWDWYIHQLQHLAPAQSAVGFGLRTSECSDVADALDSRASYRGLICLVPFMGTSHPPGPRTEGQRRCQRGQHPCAITRGLAVTLRDPGTIGEAATKTHNPQQVPQPPRRRSADPLARWEADSRSFILRDGLR
jgi:hypothetical protein